MNKVFYLFQHDTDFIERYLYKIYIQSFYDSDRKFGFLVNRRRSGYSHSCAKACELKRQTNEMGFRFFYINRFCSPVHNFCNLFLTPHINDKWSRRIPVSMILRAWDSPNQRYAESLILRINNAESFLDKKFRRRLPVARSMDSATPHIKVLGVSDSPEQRNAESLILPVSRFSITISPQMQVKKNTFSFDAQRPSPPPPCHRPSSHRPSLYNCLPVTREIYIQFMYWENLRKSFFGEKSASRSKNVRQRQTEQRK
jgi:hypothetical protein